MQRSSCLATKVLSTTFRDSQKSPVACKPSLPQNGRTEGVDAQVPLNRGFKHLPSKKAIKEVR